MAKPAEKIEQIATSSLIPYARNARLHSDAQVAQIAASIKEFGFCNPVLIDKDNGIIAGHGRVMAAHAMKLDKVPCIRLSHLTETQKRAYIIADNRISETGGGWDIQLLALEIEDLRLEDFNIDLTGFDSSALEEMFSEYESSNDDETDITPDESSSKEIDPDEYQMGHRRPRCGFEFNDNGTGAEMDDDEEINDED